MASVPKSKYDELVCKFEELIKQTKKLSQEKGKLKTELDARNENDWMNKYNEKMEELQAEREKHADTKNKLNLTVDKMKSMVNEYKKIKAKVEKQETQIQQLTDNIDHAKSNEKSLLSDIDQLEMKLSKGEEEYESRIASLKLKWTELESKSEQQILEKTQLLAEKEAEIAQSSALLAEKNTMLEDALRNAKEVQDDAKVIEMDGRIMELNKTIKELHDTIDEKDLLMEQQTQSMNEDSAQIHEQMEKQIQELKERHQQFEKVQQELEQVKQQLKHQSQQMIEHDLQTQERNQQIEHLKQQMQEQDVLSIEKEQQMQDLTDQLEKQAVQLQEKHEQIEPLNQLIQSKDSDMEKVNEKLKESAGRIEQLNEELKNSVDRKEQQAKHIEEGDTQNEKLKNLLKDKECQIKKLEQELETISLTFQSNKKDDIVLENEVLELKNQLADMDVLNHEITNLRDSEKALTEQLNALQTENESIVEESKRTLEEKNEDIASTKNQLQIAIKAHEELSAAANQREAELKTEFIVLQQQLEERNATELNLNESARIAESTMKANAEHVAALNAKITELKDEKNTALDSAKNEELETRADEIKEKCEKLEQIYQSKLLEEQERRSGLQEIMERVDQDRLKAVAARDDLVLNVEKLKQDLSTLQVTAEKSNDESREKGEQFKLQLSDLTLELTSAKNCVSSLKQKEKDIAKIHQQEMEDHGKENAALNEQVNDLNAKILTMEAAAASIGDANQQIEKYKSELVELQTLIAEQSEGTIKLQQHLDATEAEKMDLQVQLQSTEQCVLELKESLDAVQSTNTSIREELDALKNSKNADIAMLKEQLTTFEDTAQSSKYALAQANESLKQLALNSDEKIQGLNDQLAEYASKLKDMSSSIESQQSIEQQQTEQLVTDLQRELKEKQAYAQKLEEAIAAQKVAIEKLQGEAKASNAKYSEMMESLNIKAELAGMTSEEYRIIAKRYAHQTSAAKEKRTQLLVQYTMLQTQSKKLHDAYKTLKANFSTLKGEKESLETEMSNRVPLDSVEEEKRVSEAKIESMRSKLEVVETELVTFKASNLEMEKELLACQSNNEQLESSLTEMKQNFEEKHKVGSTELEQLKESLENSKKELVDSLEAAEKYKARSTAALKKSAIEKKSIEIANREKLEALQLSHDAVLATSNAEQLEMRNSVLQAQTDFEEANVRIESLVKELDEVKRELIASDEKYRESCVSRDDQISTLENRISSTSQDIEIARKDAHAQQNIIAELKKESASKSELARKLLEERDIEIKQLKSGSINNISLGDRKLSSPGTRTLNILGDKTLTQSPVANTSRQSNRVEDVSAAEMQILKLARVGIYKVKFWAY